ncbi:nucleoside 2-deoxyribosyltransferase [Paraburkholderia sp. GAS42]|uniref:nucleoside 2-deoxyribosyltransferase n=1 Tax=Paraburkholderia sp. GAS42 TaxID=3035135 RepID=UPI003D1C3AD1
MARYLPDLCASFGFDGIYPIDANVPHGMSPYDRAAWIYRSIIEAIRACVILMANVDDFRGPKEADSGTAFEIGFGATLNKDVWAYTTNEGTVLDGFVRMGMSSRATDAMMHFWRKLACRRCSTG